MDWKRGFSAEYYVRVVDPVSWSDTGRIEIVSGSISREEADLRESASFEARDYDQGTERWVRVYLDARQGEDAAHEPLFTGIATSPADSVNGTVVTNTVDCFSVLKPASDILLERGWYAPAGMDAGVIIRQLLEATPAPVSIEADAPRLSEPVIAEDGESHLTMTDKLLQAIGWRLRIAGDGSILIGAKSPEPVATFDPLENDIVEPELSIEYDWYSAPNVFRAVSGDTSAVARDDRPSSPLSTVSRGREVWMEESGADLSDGETIAAYAIRRLAEEQTIATSAEYSRRFLPGVVPGDVVALRYPAQGLSGDFTVTSQTIELGYGARTSESVQG